MGVIAKLVKGLTHLVSPRVCRVCGCTLTSHEEVLCLGCVLSLPRTNVHHSDFNEIHRRLGHHTSVDRAAAWFYYKKDTDYAQMLVDSKYNGLPKIDYVLGKICAKEFISDNFFDGVDILVPMPMHWWKCLIRGYNQAEEICRGVSESTGIEYHCALRAVKSHGVQSRHTRAQRYARIAHTLIVCDTSVIKDKHVMLIDDIITSGASCSEALRALSLAKPKAISVMALGLTMRQ